MTQIAYGEVTPKNLPEALALEALMLATIPTKPDDALCDRAASHLADIWGGQYPIRSPEDAMALLDRMVVECEDSSGPFIEGVVNQVNGYLRAQADTKAAEVSDSMCITDLMRAHNEAEAALNASRRGDDTRELDRQFRETIRRLQDPGLECRSPADALAVLRYVKEASGEDDVVVDALIPKVIAWLGSIDHHGKDGTLPYFAEAAE